MTVGDIQRIYSANIVLELLEFSAADLRAAKKLIDDFITKLAQASDAVSDLAWEVGDIHLTAESHEDVAS